MAGFWLEGAGVMLAEAAAPASVMYTRGPALLVFADDPADRHRLEDAVTAAGGRARVMAGLDAAVTAMAGHAAPDGVVIDLRGAEEGATAPILKRIDQAAQAGAFSAVALITPEQIDLAAARAGHVDVRLLCGDEEADLADALAALVAGAARGARLNDSATDDPPPDLRTLSEEISRIARTLAAMSEAGAEGEAAAQATPPEPKIEAPAIRAMIRARRLRDPFFPGCAFEDPQWDMLLDLMAARLEGQDVAVSSLCIAAAVPPTTALRSIKTMTEQGLLTRIDDPQDRRRIFIRLSDPAAAAMMACLTAMMRVSGAGV